MGKVIPVNEKTFQLAKYFCSVHMEKRYPAYRVKFSAVIPLSGKVVFIWGKHYLLATAVCGYKGYQISVYLLAKAVPVCGYKGYQISVYLLATAVCGYKGYKISVYLIATSC